MNQNIKYMVMETHTSYAVVMDEAGRFSKVANMHYDIGQTIDQVFPLEAELTATTIKSKTGSKRNKIIAAVASLAACLLIAITFAWNGTVNTTFASVYLTINPEVKIEVNKNNTVVGLSGINADGSSLIEGYDYNKKHLHLVTEELVDKAIELGFLSEGGMISLDIDAPDEGWFQSTGIALREQLHGHLDQHMGVTIEVKQHHHNNGNGQGGEQNKPPSGNNQLISKEQALAAALNHAGVSSSSASEKEVELDDDDDYLHYEVSFRSANIEYEYQIDAQTGAVLSYEHDRDDDDDWDDDWDDDRNHGNAYHNGSDDDDDDDWDDDRGNTSTYQPQNTQDDDDDDDDDDNDSDDDDNDSDDDDD